MFTCSFDEAFVLRPGIVPPAGWTGLALDRLGVAREDGSMRLRLSVGYRVPETVRGQYRDLLGAIVLHVERADPDLLSAMPLVDPAQPVFDYEPNFAPRAWGSQGALVTGGAQVVVRVPGPSRAPIYVHASFRDYISAMLVVEPEESP
jgi:hypothetical protein